MGLGPLEIISIVLVVVLLFGAKKIPELSKSIGEGLKEFKKAIRKEDEKESDDKDKK